MPTHTSPETAARLQREIKQKEARCVYLKDFILSNIRNVTRQVEDDWNTDAATRFEEFAVHCHHLASIREEIPQMKLDLERINEEQMEMLSESLRTGKRDPDDCSI